MDGGGGSVNFIARYKTGELRVIVKNEEGNKKKFVHKIRNIYRVKKDSNKNTGKGMIWS